MLSKPPFPLPVFLQGSKVQVYMGAGWSNAVVLSSNQNKCSVQLSVSNRIITVNDARCVRPIK